MSVKEKNIHHAIVDINFCENLTWSTCSTMVVEIIKYLVYQKQQIPYPFQQLKLLVDKGKVSHAGAVNAPKKHVQLGRYHSKAAEAVETFESIFKNIEAEFLLSGQHGLGGVEEVVVLLGATPVTPKDIFRIQIPEIRGCYDFETPKPPPRKMMVHLLRCLLESESLHLIVSQPLTTTNTYIFFKRKRNVSTPEHFTNRSWFLPREGFKVPQRGRQAVLRLEHTQKETMMLDMGSPLAQPLQRISEKENIKLGDEQSRIGLNVPLEKMEKLQEQDECGQVIRTPAVNLSNHLIFKQSHFQAKPQVSSNSAMSSENANSDSKVQCLIESVPDCVTGLSDSFDKLSFSPNMEHNMTNLNYIEWFEARAPIRGFKDCVVNGVSAISS